MSRPADDPILGRELEEMIRAYNGGQGVKEIARAKGYSYGKVYAMLKPYVEFRRRGNPGVFHRIKASRNPDRLP